MTNSRARLWLQLSVRDGMRINIIFIKIFWKRALLVQVEEWKKKIRVLSPVPVTSSICNRYLKEMLSI